MKENEFLNIFGFITNLDMVCESSKLDTYCVLYTLKRKDFKELLTPEQFVYFNSLFEAMLSFKTENLNPEPLELFYNELQTK